jgi:hypothetical protein
MRQKQRKLSDREHSRALYRTDASTEMAKLPERRAMALQLKLDGYRAIAFKSAGRSICVPATTRALRPAIPPLHWRRPPCPMTRPSTAKIIPECRSASLRNQRSASPEPPVRHEVKNS